MEKPSLDINMISFRRNHDWVKHLQEGSEGRVSLWKENSGGRLIALKEPVTNNRLVFRALRNEIMAMRRLGRHSHIVQFLGATEGWKRLVPAIFYEFCELGDAEDYGRRIHASGVDVPEHTLWKFFIDMTKALDYLHNSFEVRYVHGDTKPNNILVSRPSGDSSELPLAPIFKLADISRITMYKRGSRGPYDTYCGTWEYAPPLEQRKAPLAPSVDIYAIGASLQTLAWDIWPVPSEKAIMGSLIAAGDPHYPATQKTVRKLRDDEEYRKTRVAVVYRPLNANEQDQITKHDMPYSQPPYSTTINEWYTMCLRHDPIERVSSKVLKEYFLPLAESQFRLHKAKHHRAQMFERVNQLKQQRFDRQQARDIQTKGKALTRRPASAVDGVAARAPFSFTKTPEQAQPQVEKNKGNLKEAERDDGKAKKKFSRF
jgi:serine/threonine protein kinase